MNKRFFTLFVLTNDASKPRQFKVPVKTFKVAGAVSAFFCLILAFMLFDYIRLKAASIELSGLKKENTAQRLELQGFAGKIKELEVQLAKLNLFDKKIRSIAKIDDKKGIAKNDQLLGMGGDSSAEEEEFFTGPKAKVDELVGKMRSEITQLESRAKTQETSFSEIHDYLLKQQSYLASTPSIWPLRGWVTSNYGERTSPFTGSQQHHTGIDIANRVGTPVIATADGIVVEVERGTALGKNIVISHGYGMRTTYGHLEEAFVKPGQKIKRGTKIGSVGNTGRSTGPHLHYEVSLNGVAVNPSKYILN